MYESFAAGSYSELDYEQEATNQKRFQKELNDRKCPVVIPHVYDEFTTEKIITSQWIDGVKLADSSKERIRELIPVGVELFLTQLLDIGAFHAGKGYATNAPLHINLGFDSNNFHFSCM